MGPDPEPWEIVEVVEARGDFGAASSRMDALLRAGCARIVLDVDGLSFLSSSDVGRLLRTSVQLARAGGGLALARPAPFVREMFRVLGVDRRIPLFTEVAEAVRHLLLLSASAKEGKLRFELVASSGVRSPQVGRLRKVGEHGLLFEWDLPLPPEGKQAWTAAEVLTSLVAPKQRLRTEFRLVPGEDAPPFRLDVVVLSVDFGPDESDATIAAITARFVEDGSCDEDLARLRGTFRDLGGMGTAGAGVPQPRPPGGFPPRGATPPE